MNISVIREKQLVQKLFLSFMMYAVLGWCYEVILETCICRWEFTNRGVLFGPYCPIYGVGAMAFLLCFGRLMQKKNPSWLKFVKPVLIFFGCMTLATLIELSASYLFEWITGSWPWTYESYPYNFEARIALSTSLWFGIGGTAFLYLVQPFFNWVMAKMSRKTLNILSASAAAVVLCDCVYTFFIR